MKVLLVDHYDSFTFNLYQMLGRMPGVDAHVVKHDDSWSLQWACGFDAIILSPGPGNPADTDSFSRIGLITEDFGIPILGVCLGHQAMVLHSGGRVSAAPEPMHGRISKIEHNEASLFAGIPNGFQATRYHSLCAETLPPCLEPIAWSADDGVIMAVRHLYRPMWGVQFHPESIATHYGETLLSNFLKLAGAEAVQDGLQTPPQKGRPAKGAPKTHSSSGTLMWRSVTDWAAPETIFDELFAHRESAFWLDSSASRGPDSRFSFMGMPEGPRTRELRYNVHSQMVTAKSFDGRMETIEGSIFDVLDESLNRRSTAREPGLQLPFQGGWVGYFGYELKGECEGDSPHESNMPDAIWFLIERFLAFDHQNRTIYAVAWCEPGEEEEVQAWLTQKSDAIAAAKAAHRNLSVVHNQTHHLTLRRGARRYVCDIKDALEFIGRGDSYEICLTDQLQGHSSLDPWLYYQRLRQLNPAPHAAYFKSHMLHIACSSPERFLKFETDGLVEARPIKGTRPRGKTAEDDLRIRTELAAAVKDRAENLMIVDLLRNDLGRVCEIGSVSVPALMTVESFATVHQLVSTVRGRLAPGRSRIDCIRSAFPGGSMTGAPKKRTMAIIDGLEAGPRGVYSGALGYLGFNGSGDLNIVIRTAVFHEGKVSIGAGGAIVWLSDPNSELEEMFLKARILCETMGVETVR